MLVLNKSIIFCVVINILNVSNINSYVSMTVITNNNNEDKYQRLTITAISRIIIDVALVSVIPTSNEFTTLLQLHLYRGCSSS